MKQNQHPVRCKRCEMQEWVESRCT